MQLHRQARDRDCSGQLQSWDVARNDLLRQLAVDHDTQGRPDDPAKRPQTLGIAGKPLSPLLFALLCEVLPQAFGIPFILRTGMIGIENRQFLRRNRFKRWLFDVGVPALQMFEKPGIHHLAGVHVVLVAVLQPGARLDLILRGVESVKLPQLWITLGEELARPVVSRTEGQRLGCKEGGDFDISCANPQMRGIFTDTSALHACGNHHGGKGGTQTIIDGS